MIGKLGLIVDFEIQPDKVDQFLELITENAKSSMGEPGCRQFDILRAADQPNRIILYEIYDDGEALKAHGTMPHVASFFAAAKPLIVKQSVIRMDRLVQAEKPAT
jgi:autoinducer 2-degrading protein